MRGTDGMRFSALAFGIALRGMVAEYPPMSARLSLHRYRSWYVALRYLDSSAALLKSRYHVPSNGQFPADVKVSRLASGFSFGLTSCHDHAIG